jgi:hypothetical protein
VGAPHVESDDLFAGGESVTARINPRRLVCAGIALAALAAAPLHAEMSAEELAKLAQNPVGNLISVPFQNNTNFGVGPHSGTQNVLNVQPVIPITINPDWNLITRTIMPLIWQPGSYPGQGTRFGLGDIQITGFVSPSKPGPAG